MTIERNIYGIPHPSDPMPTFGTHMSHEQESEAVVEAEAEIALVLAQEEEDDMQSMYNYS